LISFFSFRSARPGLVGRLLVLGRQVTGQFGQRLLGALGLEVIPLVRGLGLLDRGIVLVQTGVGLGGAAHVGEHGAHRGDDGREHGDLVGHAVAAVLGGMLQLVVVGAVDVESISGHIKLLVVVCR
jgi:hypothetical protein